MTQLPCTDSPVTNECPVEVRVFRPHAGAAAAARAGVTRCFLETSPFFMTASAKRVIGLEPTTFSLEGASPVRPMAEPVAGEPTDVGYSLQPLRSVCFVFVQKRVLDTLSTWPRQARHWLHVHHAHARQSGRGLRGSRRSPGGAFGRFEPSPGVRSSMPATQPTRQPVSRFRER